MAKRFLPFPKWGIYLVVAIASTIATVEVAFAADNLAGLVGGMPALTSINNQDGSTSYSLSLQVLAL
ncbi:MAG: hypothetical protein ACPHDJ_09325, partial [Candidatus Puniceispirillaceae bacterium]